MTAAQITIQSIVDRWNDPASRPLFKGSLISDDGCCCAQGDVLRVSGWDDDKLRSVAQSEADREVARILGISMAHSVLLRQVNDRQDGCPQNVLQSPEKVLGDQARRVLTFWYRLDAMTKDDWQKAFAARETAWAAAMGAAWAAAGEAVGEAARDAAWAAAGEAAGEAAREAVGASNEIQGAPVLKERGKLFFFLPMFGINDPSELDQ